MPELVNDEVAAVQELHERLGPVPAARVPQLIGFFQTEIPIWSGPAGPLEPGSPQSTMSIVTVAPPTIDIGAAGLVTSWMLAAG